MFESVMQYNSAPSNPSDFQSNDNRNSRMKFMSKERVHIVNEEIYTCSNYFNSGEDMECIEEFSSPSRFNCSENEFNDAFEEKYYGLRSTREKLTRDWVRRTSAEKNGDDSNSCFDSSFTISGTASKSEFSNIFEEKNYGLRSTREKLTRDWVRKTFAENNDDDSNSCFDSSFTINSTISESEFSNMGSDGKEKTIYSKFFSYSKSDDDADMSEHEFQMVDDSVVFAGEKAKEIECSLDSTISFLQVVTEENCKDGLSFTTRGSLSCFVDEEFCDDEEDDIEFMLSSPTLSSAALPGLCDQKDGDLSQSFDIDSFFDFKKISKVLQDINDKWNNSMDDIADKPREPIKVSFAPLEELVTVHSFENTSEENMLNDSSQLDQLRFKHRIKELNALLSPFLTSEHRAKIVFRNNI